MHRLSLGMLLLIASAAASAQDATVTLPANYKLEFENAWVKVTRVHYPPHAKLPAHAHTSLPSAYVYLNDSGPVTFRHIGGENSAVTRAPTTAGSFRIFRAVPAEIHEVDNTSPLPSEFLRVEFKTDPGAEPRTLRGKFLPEPAADEPMQKVQFENAQLRIHRLFSPPHKAILVPAGDHPSLVVMLSDGENGTLRWLMEGVAERIESPSHTAMHALRFELKTRPRFADASPQCRR